MITTAQLIEGQKMIPDEGIKFQVKLVNLTRYALCQSIKKGRNYTGLWGLHRKQCILLVQLVRCWNDASLIIEQQGNQIKEQLIGV